MTHLTDEIRAEVAAGEVPGLTLFTYVNIGSVGQVRNLTAALQAARPEGAPPLIIAADQEGGQLQGLGDEATPLTGNLALGAVGDIDLAERVGALAAAFVRGIRSAGVAATLKHFSGKGGVTVDTHHHLGIIEADRDALDAHELAAFREPIAAGAKMVMSGHFAVPALTGRRDLPATLARGAMHDVLRDELGFAGVTITDALDMAALAQGAGQILDAMAALGAGVDLLLCGPDQAANRRLRDGLRQAHARRLLDPVELRASADRIERLRRHLDVAEQPDLDVVACPEHLALADEVARRSVTLVRDDAGLLPLTFGSDAEVVVVEPRPRDLTPADTSAVVQPTLASAMRPRLPRTRGIVVEGSPSDAEVRGVAEAVRGADLVVLGLATAATDPGEASLVLAVVGGGAPVIGVALRSPADLVPLAFVATALCTYGPRAPSTDALAAVLTGEIVATGTLPLRLPG